MTESEALYAILANDCPLHSETDSDGVEWRHFEITLHCLTVKVWCRFIGKTVIVRSIDFID